jgi:hypothetical protein
VTAAKSVTHQTGPGCTRSAPAAEKRSHFRIFSIKQVVDRSVKSIESRAERQTKWNQKDASLKGEFAKTEENTTPKF